MAGWLDPNVEQYILRDADEELVVEVRKHWIASFLATIRLAIGLVIFVSAWAFEEPIYWVFFVIGLAIVLQALWRVLEEYRDRFIITNQRVFRVHGVLNVHRATIPLGRILDTTVEQAADRSAAQLRSFRIRVGGPGPGPERDPLRCRHRRTRTAPA